MELEQLKLGHETLVIDESAIRQEEHQLAYVYRRNTIPLCLGYSLPPSPSFLSLVAEPNGK